MMKLVDTAAWIHQMRERGDPDVCRRVEQLLLSGRAAWCGFVRLELWAGIGDAREHKMLKHYEQVIPDLDITAEVWQQACELGSLCRKAGKTVPASDLLIAACARHHGVEVESPDAHFELLMAL
jgi:predicted nucleic acid-binding protein